MQLTKLLACLLALALTLASASGTETKTSYARQPVFRLQAPDQSQFLRALDLLDDWSAQGLADVWRAAFPEIDVRLTSTAPHLLQQLEDLELSGQVWIEDVQKLIDQVSSMAPSQLAEDDFFNNFQRAEAILQKTRELCAASHSSCEFVPSIGRTANGKDIFAAAVGGRVGGPLLYLQGGIHAREWVSPATTLWILKELTTSRDPRIVDILSRVQIFVTPLLNIDGYEYCHTDSRLWRKNRQAPPSGSSCIGVDLNRNWGEKWGGGGSSPSPCSDTYRGTSAFSAPESAAVERLLLETLPRKGYNVIGGLDMHSYGQLILRPFGYQLPSSGVPANDAELKALGDGMREAILNKHGMRYTSEHAAELYVAAGGADDWFHAVASKGKIGFTIELRDTGRYGFILPPDQIVPTGEEAWEAFKVLLEHVAVTY